MRDLGHSLYIKMRKKNILKMKKINAHNFFSKTNLYHECIISGYNNECAYNAIA